MSTPSKAKASVEPAWLVGESGGDGASNGHSSSSTGAEPSQVKSESDAPKTAGFKPKFVPKVPVKKEAPVPVVPDAAAASASSASGAAKGDNKNGYDRNQKKNGNKPLMINKFTPRNKAGGQDGHPAGGRKWVMPVGAAFFQGTNAVGSSAGASATSGGAASTARASAGSGTAIVAGSSIGRILRPNERIEQVAPRAVTKSASNVSFVSYAGTAESDSDADDEEAEDDLDDPNALANEVWPPLDYDPLAPLALPLGPKSQSMRNQLAAEPILADPLDRAAMAKEQGSSLFVLQLPTDLKFDKLKELAPAGEDTSKIHIGKVQLLKSGRVRLIALDGSAYEVNSGMASSFVQILSTIEVPPESSGPSTDVLSSASAAGSSGAAAAGQSRAGAGAAAARAQQAAAADADSGATMHLMGSITKKLVITPSHDIGVRRPRAYSANVKPAANNNVPNELMYALGQQQQHGNMYGDGDEVVMGEE